MKTSRGNTTQAITLIETIVVIAAMALLAILILPAFSRAKVHCGITCVNHLKQIGLAFKEWSLDNDSKYPMQALVANGGATEKIMTGNVASMFRVMSNELNTPRILVCPLDTARTLATNFEGSLHNSNISYFVSLSVSNPYPGMLLSGDRNLTNGLPVRHGLLELPAGRPAGWTSEIHNGAGNFLMADGSVFQCNNSQLNRGLQNFGAATNLLAIP